MYDFYERDKVYTSKQKSDIASAPAVLYVFMRRFRILLGQCTSCDTRTDYCMFLCGDSDYCWDSVPAVIPVQITVRFLRRFRLLLGQCDGILSQVSLCDYCWDSVTVFYLRYLSLIHLLGVGK